jgi:protein SCO1/2
MFADSPAPRLKPLFNALPLVLLAFVASGVGMVYWTSHRAAAVPPLPDYGAAPEFALTRENGETVKSSDLAGSPWIADFIFTRCQGVCPFMTSKLGDLQKKLPGFRFVSFSVDPGHDTPAALSEYASRYGADTSRWIFLTGDPAAADRVTAAFHMNPTAEPSMHSSRFALVDAYGRIRGYYDSSDEEAMGRLEKDAAVLKKQSLHGF